MRAFLQVAVAATVVVLVLVALAQTHKRMWKAEADKYEGIVSSLRAELAASKARTLTDGTTKNGSATTDAAGLDAAARAAGVDAAAVRSDAQASGGNVAGVGRTTVSTTGQSGRGVGSTKADPAPMPPSAPTPQPAPAASCKYAGTTQRFELSDKFGELTVPWGQVGFAAADDKPWSFDVWPRTLTVGTVVAVQEDGSHRLYTHLDAEVQGKHYTLPSQESKWLEELPQPKLRWSFKPYLGAGLGVGLGAQRTKFPSFGAAASVSLASYGRTTATPTWSFALLGVGGTSDRRAAIFAAPVAWNVGEPLPLFDALFLAPTWAMDTSGAQSLFLMLHAKL